MAFIWNIIVYYYLTRENHETSRKFLAESDCPDKQFSIADDGGFAGAGRIFLFVTEAFYGTASSVLTTSGGFTFSLATSYAGG